MTSSRKAAYVANGADLDQPFEDNELLNQKDDFPFEDPPWRVLDTEATFEPMEIASASAATAESSTLLIRTQTQIARIRHLKILTPRLVPRSLKRKLELTPLPNPNLSLNPKNYQR